MTLIPTSVFFHRLVVFYPRQLSFFFVFVFVHVSAYVSIVFLFAGLFSFLFVFSLLSFGLFAFVSN